MTKIRHEKLKSDKVYNRIERINNRSESGIIDYLSRIVNCPQSGELFQMFQLEVCRISGVVPLLDTLCSLSPEQREVMNMTTTTTQA